MASPRPALLASLGSVPETDQEELRVVASMGMRGDTRREQQSPYPANASGTFSPAHALAAEDGRRSSSGQLLGTFVEGEGQGTSAEACTKLPAHHSPQVWSLCSSNHGSRIARLV